MKIKVTLFSLLFLALGLVVALPGAMAGAGGDAVAYGGIGFGKRIAGTYFSPAGFGGALTLTADGTVVALSGACCGNSPNIQSEAYGNWVRTGEYSIQLRTVAIGTNHDFSNADPMLQGPTGNWIATPMVDMEFAPDFQSFAGTLCTSLWFYDLGGSMPDVDVDPPLLTLGPFPYAMSRLAVFVECPPPD
jgi:hypothetical protein